MSGDAKVSGLMYPLLQILDVKYLEADITVGGIDQRNIYMLGRELLESVGFHKSSYIFMPLLPSLKGGGSKMSASDPASQESILSCRRIRAKSNHKYNALHYFPEI
jgi:tyrosyl-tRNA synthetase